VPDNWQMEYESFHFLVHKQVDLPPNYVKAVAEKPPTFEELWLASPGALLRKTLRKEEKLFWRSRQRLEFIFEEARGQDAIIVNVREIDTDVVSIVSKIWGARIPKLNSQRVFAFLSTCGYIDC
jgi:hypothetical protein